MKSGCHFVKIYVKDIKTKSPPFFFNQLLKIFILRSVILCIESINKLKMISMFIKPKSGSSKKHILKIKLLEKLEPYLPVTVVHFFDWVWQTEDFFIIKKTQDSISTCRRPTHFTINCIHGTRRRYMLIFVFR